MPTVLSRSNDPYRVGTPAGHRAGAWFAEELDRAIGSTRRIHLRGLHHGLLGERRPDSRLYVNDDPTWSWLAGPAKAARFLGFVPFARIIDARNGPPVINHQMKWLPALETRYVRLRLQLVGVRNIDIDADGHPRLGSSARRLRWPTWSCRSPSASKRTCF